MNKIIHLFIRSFIHHLSPYFRFVQSPPGPFRSDPPLSAKASKSTPPVSLASVHGLSGGGGGGGGIGVGGSVSGGSLLSPPDGKAARQPLAPSSIAESDSPLVNRKSQMIGAGYRRPMTATPQGPAAKKAKPGPFKDISFMEASKYGSLNEFAFFDKVRTEDALTCCSCSCS